MKRKKNHSPMYMNDEKGIVRGHYVSPPSSGTLPHHPSNSIDIAWPAVDYYWTSLGSFYIYYIYLSCCLSGLRVVT